MKSHRFPLHRLAAAVALALPVWAHAAGLGKLTVNSALGQPLSAEIELLAADKNELDSLSANLASGQAFKDAQIEYAAVMTSLQFSVDKSVEGRPVLRISTQRPVVDPFLDMLIELNWASGRLLREYTVLLDPPGMAIPQTVAPVDVSVPEVQTPAQPAPVVEAPVKPVEAPVATKPPKTSKKATKKTGSKAKAAEATPKPEPAPQAAAETQNEPPKDMMAGAAEPAPAQSQPTGVPVDNHVRVQKGDTLAEIARDLRRSNVNLEQLLVGLFRENPQAFDGGNMNRLKSGSTLKIPADSALESIGKDEAVREVKLQADDWQAYRAKLAEKVAETPAPAAAKEPEKKVSTGKITPKVEDKAQPKAESKDVLKLSRPAPPAPAAAKSPSASDKAAEAAKQAAAKATQAKATKDKATADKMAADKAAAAKLAAEKAAAEKAAAAKAAADKAAAEQEERTAREKAAKEAAEREAMLEKQIADMKKLAEMKDGEAVAKGAQKPAAPAAPKVAAAPPVEQPEANWYDGLLSNPLYWIGGLGAVVLGGVLWWMMAGGRRRKEAVADFDDSLLSGGELPNTVVGSASGGAVNTGDTSFLTDFSQAGLAAVDTHDVDPIAEADVYMAYGRDAQAEEILREALVKSPDRHEIRLKLLEIHAARKNVSAFETMAGELYSALGGQNQDIWDKATELGRSIDPTNALYGGSPAAAVQAPAPAPVDNPTAEEAKAEPVQPEAAKAEMPVVEAMDFNLDLPSEPAKAAKDKAPELDEPTTIGNALDFDLSGLDLGVPDSTPNLKLDEVPAASGGMDFSGLDLNLEDLGSGEDEDEVSTKLDLARAYLEMGDKEGAREILQEVLSEGNDAQKKDAQGIIASL